MKARRPKCSGCGKSLYRTKTPAKRILKSLPCVYCRNQECEIYKAQRETPESKQVEALRTKISDAMHRMGKTNAEYGLAIALACIVNGDVEAAGELIKKYDLKKFGLK